MSTTPPFTVAESMVALHEIVRSAEAAGFSREEAMDIAKTIITSQAGDDH